MGPYKQLTYLTKRSELSEHKRLLGLTSPCNSQSNYFVIQLSPLQLRPYYLILTDRTRPLTSNR